MSQYSTPTGSPNDIAPGPNNPPKVNRDNLRQYLTQAAGTMRRVELGVGITGWLCTLVVVILAAILVDHWLWPLSMLARYAILIFLVGWSVWWVPRRILPFLYQSIHPEHAARKIELQHPEMKESLISWLQLSSSVDSAPKGVLATVGRFAVRNLGGQDSTSIVDSAVLIRLAALLFGFLLTGTVYLFASPKSGVTSLSRMLMPWSNIAPAARVRFVSVSPGTTTITQGSSLPLSVAVRGMLQSDQVFVRYDLSDGQQIGQRLKMNSEIEGVSYRLDLGKSFGGIHQPLNYWIDAGDAIAGPFSLSVQVVPIVAIDRVEFEYPKYTRLKPRTLLQDGIIEAPEGTRVKLYAHSNQPMTKSRIEFDPIMSGNVFVGASSILDLETDATQIKGQWMLQLDKKGTNPTLSSYRVKATNSLNESNGDPVLYKIKVFGDLHPEVMLQSDLNQVVDVPVNGSKTIEMRAFDPDFGLTALTATGRLPKSGTSDEKLVFSVPVFESASGTAGQITKVFTFTPSEFDLKAGDAIQFVAIATDNRCKVGEDTPEPNEGRSKPITLRVVDADTNAPPNPDIEPKVESQEPKREPQSPTKGKESDKDKKTRKNNDDEQNKGDSKKSDNQESNSTDNSGDSNQEKDSKSSPNPKSGQAGSSDSQPDKSNVDQNDSESGDDADAFEKIEQLRQEKEGNQPKNQNSQENKEPQPSEQNSNQPDAGKPDAGKPDAGKPDAGKPDAGKPDAGKPDAGKPDAGKPDAGKPDQKQLGEPDPSKLKSNPTGSPPSKTTGAPSADQADEANKEYADKVTDLALDYLKSQKDQPDPELLKRLNWSKEDMQKFLERWSEAKEGAKSDPLKKKELDAALKSLGLRPSKSRDRKVQDRDDDLKGFRDEGSRVRPPESVREQFEQFRKAAGSLE